MLGVEVKAFVGFREGRTATGEKLIQHCEVNFAQSKCPRIIEFLPLSPRT